MEKTQKLILIGVAGVVAVGMSVLLIVGGNTNSSSQGGNASAGLQETPGPWQPEYQNLASRIKALNIPPPGTEKYHVHARLKVYAEGKELPVPANIGLSQQSQLFSALHSHEQDGIIHIEADNPFEVKLSDYFTVWGVKFSSDQLGGYRNAADKTVQAYVNGNKVDDPASYVVKAQDSIAVGYGAASSFPPNPFAEPFPTNL